MSSGTTSGRFDGTARGFDMVYVNCIIHHNAAEIVILWTHRFSF